MDPKRNDYRADQAECLPRNQSNKSVEQGRSQDFVMGGGKRKFGGGGKS